MRRRRIWGRRSCRKWRGGGCRPVFAAVRAKRRRPWIRASLPETRPPGRMAHVDIAREGDGGRYFHMDFSLCLDIQLTAAPTPPNAHRLIMKGSRPDVDFPKEEPGYVGRGYTHAHPSSPAPRRGRPEDRRRGDLGVTLLRYRYPRRRCGEIGYECLHNSRDVGICRCPRSTEGLIRNTRIRTKKYEIAEADANPPGDGRSEAAIGPFRPRRPIRSCLYEVKRSASGGPRSDSSLKGSRVWWARPLRYGFVGVLVRRQNYIICN